MLIYENVQFIIDHKNRFNYSKWKFGLPLKFEKKLSAIIRFQAGRIEHTEIETVCRGILAFGSPRRYLK